MKKLKILVLLLICSIFAFIPFSSLNAESREIYYPSGISDYVDLNNIKHFAVDNSKIFYSKSDNVVICYDKNSKDSTTLTTSGEVYNICVEGDYAFIFTSTGTYTFSLTTLATAEFNYPPSSYKAISANYKNGKYYFAYIKNSTYPSFEVFVYNSLASTASSSYSYSTAIDSTFSQSLIAFSDDLIVLKPVRGGKILLFNYPTTGLNPIKEDNNDYHSIMSLTDYSQTNSMEVVKSGTDNCILVGTSSETIICKFNGTGLTFNTDNSISDIMKTYNNQLYSYNTNNANVCKYSCDFNSLKLTNDEIFLAGKGVEVGRFKDVTNINFKSGNIYVTDSGNNRIQNLYPNNIETFNFTGNCSEIVLDNENNYYYVVSNGSTSNLYKNQSTYVKTFASKNIISIDIGVDNTIYMLTKNGEIITYGNSSSNAISLGFNVNSDSKIRIISPLTDYTLSVDSIAQSSSITVSVDNKIYNINKSTGQSLKTLEFTGAIKDYKVNNAYTNSPLFVLQEDGKLTRSNFTESQENDVSLSGFDNYSCLSLNKVSGEIQLYNNSISAIEIYKNNEFSPSTSMIHYYPGTSIATGNSDIWKYGEVKANALVYDYYYFTGNYTKLSTSTQVIILNANEEFVYMGYVANNCLNFGYIKRADLITTNNKDIQEMAIANTETTIKLRATNKNVSVFKYPTIYNDVIIHTYNQGDTINALGKYTTNIDGLNYYVVKIGNNYGYICSNNVVLSDNISKSIKTNAKIKIYDESEKVDVYLTNEDGSSVLCQLPDGYKINVENYNKDEKYTFITFVDEDQQEREGYVLTSYVKMDGLSTAVITAIVLLSLDIVIAVVVIIFYRHYKKKQKENSMK